MIKDNAIIGLAADLMISASASLKVFITQVLNRPHFDALSLGQNGALLSHA